MLYSFLRSFCFPNLLIIIDTYDKYFKRFKNFYLLYTSIITPLIILGTNIAVRRPYIIFRFKVEGYFKQNPMSTLKLTILRCFIITFSPFLPAFLIILKDTENEKVKKYFNADIDKEKMREAKNRNDFGMLFLYLISPSSQLKLSSNYLYN